MKCKSTKYGNGNVDTYLGKAFCLYSSSDRRSWQNDWGWLTEVDKFLDAESPCQSVLMGITISFERPPILLTCTKRCYWISMSCQLLETEGKKRKYQLSCVSENCFEIAFQFVGVLNTGIRREHRELRLRAWSGQIGEWSPFSTWCWSRRWQYASWVTQSEYCNHLLQD